MLGFQEATGSRNGYTPAICVSCRDLITIGQSDASHSGNSKDVVYFMLFPAKPAAWPVRGTLSTEPLE